MELLQPNPACCRSPIGIEGLCAKCRKLVRTTTHNGGNAMSYEDQDDCLNPPDVMGILVNERKQELTRNASQYGLMTQQDADLMMEQNARKLRKATAHSDSQEDDDALQPPTMNKAFWQQQQRLQRQAEGR